MSVISKLILLIVLLIELMNALVLTYALATSKADSKKVIKAVLIGTVVYTIALLLGLKGGVVGIAILTILTVLGVVILFAVLGSQTGSRFNIGGFVFMVAYLISLGILPVLSNKYEDTLGYKAAGVFAEALGVGVKPTQLNLVIKSSDSAAGPFIMFCGVVLFTVLFFDMALLRKNTAQVFMGSMVAVCTLVMLYFDYESIPGLASVAGASLSWFCIVIAALAILLPVTAYLYNKKEKEST